MLRVFAEISGLNIVIDPAVKGTVDVALRDVPWDQALDIILRANKLGWLRSTARWLPDCAAHHALSEEETSAASSPTTRLWPANCACSPNTQLREGRRTAGASQERPVASRHGAGRSAHEHARHVGDLQPQLDAAATLIATLDTAQPPVEIEARIVQRPRPSPVHWCAVGRDRRVDPATGQLDEPWRSRTAAQSSGATGATQGAAGQQSAGQPPGVKRRDERRRSRARLRSTAPLQS